MTDTGNPPRRRRRARIAGLSALLVVAWIAVGCISVESSDGDGLLMGRDVHVQEGEVARNDIVVMGGTVRVDGEARGDVVVIGGSLTVNGRAENVVCIGGTLRVGPDAHVRGDLVNVGGHLRRSPGAQIDGEVVNVGISGFDWLPGLAGLGIGQWWGMSPFRVIHRLTQFVYWLLLALLTVALVGDRVSSAAHSIAREPVRLGAIGFVGFFALAAATGFLVLLSVLLIGLPFLLALLLFWWLAYIFGMVAVFQAIGARVSSLFGQRDATQLALVLGGAAALSVLHFFPWFGTLLWWSGGFVGLGAAFATRFGTNRPWYGESASIPPPAPPAPPAPPPPPPPPWLPRVASEPPAGAIQKPSIPKAPTGLAAVVPPAPLEPCAPAPPLDPSPASSAQPPQ